MGKKKADTIAFDEVRTTTRQYMRHVAVIDKAWLPEIHPDVYAVAAGTGRAAVSRARSRRVKAAVEVRGGR